MEKEKVENVHKSNLDLWCKVNRAAIDGASDPHKVNKALKKVLSKVRTKRVYENMVFQVGDRKFSVLTNTRPSKARELFKSLGKLKRSVSTLEEVRTLRAKYPTQFRYRREGVLFLLKEGNHFYLLWAIPSKMPGSRKSTLCRTDLDKDTIWHKVMIVVPQVPLI